MNSEDLELIETTISKDEFLAFLTFLVLPTSNNKKDYPIIKCFQSLDGRLYIGAFSNKPQISYKTSTQTAFIEAPFNYPEKLFFITPEILITVNATTNSYKVSAPKELFTLFDNKISKDKNVYKSNDKQIEGVIPSEIELSPKAETFISQVNEVKEEIQSKSLKKLVLTRKATLHFSHKLSKEEILVATIRDRIDGVLKRSNANADSYFYATLNEEELFLSFTPETLILQNTRTIYTEALAGSCFPGGGTMLLKDKKNLQENHIVLEEILNNLKKVSSKIDSSKTKIRPLPYIEHLVTEITAETAPNIAILKSAEMLHPTPAVLGYPRKIAWEYLNNHKLLPEKLHAGIGGVFAVNSDTSDYKLSLAVLIRSCSIKEQEISLFGGAGIMPDSDAKQEWIETGTKMLAAIKELGILEDVIKEITIID